MKKISILLILGVFLNLSTYSQSEIDNQIKKKIREGLDFSLIQKRECPDDIIIIRTSYSQKYFIVADSKENSVLSKEIIPPDLSNIKNILVEVSKDSLSDVLWIKKKKFQNLVLSNSEIPFPKLKSRFPNNEFESLQKEIINLEQQAYIAKIKLKYSPLKTIQIEKLDQAFLIVTKGFNNISVPIKYPMQARENGTQGFVRVGYVLTKNGSVEDFYVFHELRDGCTESVIDSIKELSRKMKDQGYKSEENIYIEGSVYFTLN